MLRWGDLQIRRAIMGVDLALRPVSEESNMIREPQPRDCLLARGLVRGILHAADAGDDDLGDLAHHLGEHPLDEAEVPLLLIDPTDEHRREPGGIGAGLAATVLLRSLGEERVDAREVEAVVHGRHAACEQGSEQAMPGAHKLVPERA